MRFQDNRDQGALNDSLANQGVSSIAADGNFRREQITANKG
jgi:hypothetical protein